MDTSIGAVVSENKDIPSDENELESESYHLAEEETMTPPVPPLTHCAQDIEENEDYKNSGNVGVEVINDSLQSSGSSGALSCCLWSAVPRHQRQRLLEENQLKVTSISRLTRHVSFKLKC